ncbi:MAG: PEGA domain-containing protein [Treponemataceae bacterium]
MKRNFVKKINFRKIFFYLIFLSFTHLSFADYVRLSYLETIELGKEKRSVKVPYGAGVAIKLDTQMDFLQGVEIEIRQGQASMNFPNAIEYNIFTCKENIDPMRIEYKATNLERRLLPQRVSTILQLPTREKNSLKNTPYSKLIAHTFKNEDGFILVQLLPILKGLSSEFEQALFTISAKPIFTNEGGLNLNLNFPNKETDTKITLNDTTVKLGKPPEFFTLPIGTYQFVLEAEGYRTEVRNIKIDQAQVLTLDINLRSIVPLLFVYVPKETKVLLNREEINTEQMPIELPVGKHILKLQLGNYEIIRQIDAEESKTYTVTMNIGVDVKVEE